MKYRVVNKVLLLDENKIIGLALKRLLEKYSMRVIRTTTSLKDNEWEDVNYDCIVLNLSYYSNYCDMGQIIENIKKYHFKRLIIISNICLRKHCLFISNRYNTTILCKKNLLSNKNLSTLVKEISSAKRIKNCVEWNHEPNSFEIDTKRDVVKDFTSREREIINLIGEGYTSNAIADKLYITKKAVDFHRRNLLKKLYCKTSAELIVFAVRIAIKS